MANRKKISIPTKKNFSYSEIKQRLKILTARVNALLELRVINSNTNAAFLINEDGAVLSQPEIVPRKEYDKAFARILTLEDKVETLENIAVDHEARISALEG